MTTEEKTLDGQHGSTLNNGSVERLANALGWFSIGLGLAEVAAPGAMAKMIGIRDRSRSRNFLRFYGVREIAAGIGILSQPQSAGWVWSRVAGDLMDLSALGTALNSSSSNRARLGTATAAVLGVTALDVICAQQLSQTSGEEGAAKETTVRITRTVVIDRPAEEIYQFWRNLSNLPRFMSRLESVEVTGDSRSHWRAKALAGKTLEWDAEIVGDEPNSRIAWRSLEGSDIESSGSVHFERAPGGRGTLVKLELEYAPPGGAIGATLAKLFNLAPQTQIEQDLRALKQIMETGEIAKSDASIHTGMHPAQPSEEHAAAATA